MDNAPLDVSVPVDASCSICLEARPVQCAHHCGHCDTKVCNDCFRSYLIHKIDDGEVAPHQLVWPGSCRQPIWRETLESFVSARQVRKYTVALEVIARRQRGQRFCPRPECGHELASSTGKSSRRVDCKSCRHVSCRDCGGAYHWWPWCDRQYRSWCRNHGARRCPSCSAIAEKVSGCNHVQCTYCHHVFCWGCRVKWEDHNHALCPLRTLVRSTDWRFGPTAPLRCVTKTLVGVAALLAAILAVGIAVVALPLACIYDGIADRCRRHRAPSAPARAQRLHIGRPRYT
ncbi:hypothetical protein SPRG_14879 [Saprolegnia parasitica CBS 223.65]|uniref:RBR-type E3 ubiquitin transferase n=1 Tax=Saprolegnia parasitica (strain CBS 223.65) TaxID=695850 RepID=A0A067BLK0_SAPPC|nr:hypothetical protein SPRG_14879 [Saprolegnia parasitica CBS 223.65]KDO19359.1 hypothetical protein SPRG_14879 [Saprolegnia parasitica CBS 223.65]|eukprot:XP_012209947.1 hypothetical protein SPRG_14879 [Saprolegnia parasitica CBS 223.65]